MSHYTTLLIPKCQLEEDEIDEINKEINKADWNWEAEFIDNGRFWQTDCRNINRGRGGGIDGMAELIKNTVDATPYIPTKLQILTRTQATEMGSRPELNIHEYSWRN